MWYIPLMENTSSHYEIIFQNLVCFSLRVCVCVCVGNLIYCHLSKQLPLRLPECGTSGCSKEPAPVKMNR